MAFISYAQNYEDVILWRALREVDHGFYVDVGASDPDVESVTRAFYERGWSGINIEPLDEHFTKLVQARPRDINLKVLVGREAGQRTFHAFPGTGLSTLNAEIARAHQAAGFSRSEILVPMLTLARIIEDWAPETIHFLKIDVEGAEAEVLEGLNLERIRPWVIVIEANEPLKPTSTRGQWEHLITERRYGFAYFDGLNCFYVADEVAMLKERLALPPNFFDDFTRYPEWSNRQEVAELKLEVAGLRGHADGLEGALRAEQGRAVKLRSALQVAQGQTANSLQHLSERIRALETQLSGPSVDRAIGRVLRRLRQTGDRFTGGGLRSLTKRALTTSAQLAVGNRSIMPLSRTVLRPFPNVSTMLHRIATKQDSAAVSSSPSSAEALPHENPPVETSLSASARSIYLRLKAAMPTRDD